MGWARFDDQRPSSPDILGLGDDVYALAAIGLVDLAIQWASSTHTPRDSDRYGLVPWAWWRQRAGKHCKRLTELLLREGHVTPDASDRGLVVAGFARYGPKRDPAEAAEAGRRGGRGRRGGGELPASYSSSNSFEKAPPKAEASPSKLVELNDPSRTYVRPSPVPVPEVALGSLDGPVDYQDAHDKPDPDHHRFTDHDEPWIEQLAQDVHAIRPSWAIGRLRAVIGDALDRGGIGQHRLTIALVFIAIAEDSTSPRRVLCDGWWWDENDTRYLQALDHPTVLAFLERSAA
jgi:hypothetical protein